MYTRRMAMYGMREKLLLRDTGPVRTSLPVFFLVDGDAQSGHKENCEEPEKKPQPVDWMTGSDEKKPDCPVGQELRRKQNENNSCQQTEH